MARMIPAFQDENTPPGERDVFNRLASCPDDWVVLHSLDLAPWNRGLRTEIDFVIIIPDTGILCVEVKSHEILTFDGERWYPPGIKRSPFKQAADGRYTFYRRLREIVPDYARAPVVHCCIFPRAVFELPFNLSVQPWELMDKRNFQACKTADEFSTVLKNMMIQNIKSDKDLVPLANDLSYSEIQHIIGACIPVQKYHPKAREEISKREELIEDLLRDQQRPILHLAESNNCLMVAGGAGTGKTLIAMELAQRKAEQGLRVGLLCYNKLIGDWMKQKIAVQSSQPPNLLVGRAIKIMAEMTNISIPENPTSIYWENKLPREIENRLTDPEFRIEAMFDYLVLDEAQDILARPNLFQCISQFIKGGFSKGQFAFFGDFYNQVLVGKEQVEEAIKKIHDTARPVHWIMSENCRNYRIIGDTALLLSGLKNNIYSGYLRSGGSVKNYDIDFYEDDQKQLEQIEFWLRDFKDQGYKPSEITILSFKSDSKCAAVRLLSGRWQIRPAWKAGRSLSYASIYAFKGMENKVIILTDIVLNEHEYQRDLFYTGLTRATESVRIICSKSAQTTIFGWIMNKDEL